MSKQDTHFFNTFSLVIGLLVAVALALFAFARVVASKTQEKQMLVESHYLKGVDERVAPFARVAVAGQDNTALKIEAPSSRRRHRRSGSAEERRRALRAGLQGVPWRRHRRRAQGG